MISLSEVTPLVTGLSLIGIRPMANSLRFALVGITIIIGANVLLAVRDSNGLKMLQERNDQICQIDPTVCQ